MSLRKSLEKLCKQELKHFRQNGEEEFRRVVGRLTSLTSGDPLWEVLENRSTVVKKAAKELQDAKAALYPWVLIPVAAVGFATVFASILGYWAWEEMNTAEGTAEREAAAKKVDDMIDRAVWAYCLTVAPSP